MVIQRHFIKTFSVSHETWYCEQMLAQADHDFEIVIGLDPIDGDGGMYQFFLQWEKVSNYKTSYIFSVKLNDDALAGFLDFPELFNWLPKIGPDEEVTPDLVKSKLIEFAYKDVTQRVKPSDGG